MKSFRKSSLFAFVCLLVGACGLPGAPGPAPTPPGPAPDMADRSDAAVTPQRTCFTSEVGKPCAGGGVCTVPVGGGQPVCK